MDNGLKIIPKSVFLRLRRLTLLDKVGDKEYILNWGYRDGYVSLGVIDKETNKSVKDARLVLNTVLLRTLVEYLEKVMSSKEEISYTIESKSRDFNNKENDALIVKGKVHIGKKKIKDYLINYIMIENGVKYPFKLLPSKYYVFYKNGERLDDYTELSNIFTKAYVKELNKILDEIPPFSEEDLFEVNLNFNKNDKKNNNKNTTDKEDDDLF